MAQLTLTRSQVRDVDRRAIDDYGLPGVVLMENAARGAVDYLCRLGCDSPVIICAGKGNNGGDGFAMARHLAIRGMPVGVILCCKASELQGDAAINYRILQRAGLAGIELGNDVTRERLMPFLTGASWIVDALLGTGTQGQVRDPYRTAIETINHSGIRVFSIDVPSGMDCDTGHPCGVCIKATATATLVAVKPGFSAAGARKLTGQVEVIEIGVPPSLIAEVIASV